MTAIDWERSAEVLHRGARFAARRSGRFLLVELLAPHRVVSTSAECGGEREDVSFLANHQSCEATGDAARYDRIAGFGQKAYHRTVCAEMGVAPDRTAVMGTAANMAYAVHRQVDFEDLRVDAFVTAGVGSNAARAGDPAHWLEGADGRWRRVAAAAGDDAAPRAGTINTILLLSCPLTPAAQARAVVTMTEAKSAALAELAAASRQSPAIATGTGTDQFCLAAPLDPRGAAKTATGPHAKLGELISCRRSRRARPGCRSRWPRVCCRAVPGEAPSSPAGASTRCCRARIRAGARRPWPAASRAASWARYGSRAASSPRSGSAIRRRPQPARQPTTGGRRRSSAWPPRSRSPVRPAASGLCGGRSPDSPPDLKRGGSLGEGQRQPLVAATARIRV